jgi:hypothetical protein
MELVRWWLEGETYTAIAAAYNLSVPRVWKVVQRWLKRHPADPAAGQAGALARLENIVRQLEGRPLTLKIARELRHIVALQCRIAGWLAPERVQVSRSEPLFGPEAFDDSPEEANRPRFDLNLLEGFADDSPGGNGQAPEAP